MIDLKRFRVDDFMPPNRLTADEILSWFDQEDAYWRYDGEPNPQRPHAQLVSGFCSNGYFDVPRVTRYPRATQVLAYHLASRLSVAHVERVDWVISSAYSAITLGHEVAKVVGAIFGHTEKDPSDPKQKRMLWRRMQIPEGSIVLQVEELITTSDTLQEVKRAVLEGNGVPVDFYAVAGTVVHRPPKLPGGERPVVGLIEQEVQAFDPSLCPYCAVGSAALRPKSHWKELAGKK